MIPGPISADRNWRPSSVLSRLASIGRTPLANVPTPLLPAPALAASLRPDLRISIKADAWTGFGLGGNKLRKLEYELDPARLRGVTDLVTAGGPHSNHCRVTAAAAAHLGLGCTLAINGEAEDPRRGNALLHRLLGARIVTVPDRDAREPAMAEEARRIAAAGGRALIVPLGASTARGALGYVHAAVEMHAQASGGRPVWIFAASSSGGTLAGLILGCAILGWRVRLVGVSPDEPAATVRTAATEIAAAAARLLAGSQGGASADGWADPPDGRADGRGDPSGGAGCGGDPPPGAHELVERVGRVAAETRFTADFVGEGYGVPTRAADEAIALFASRAGMILDPVYTGKAAAGMTAWIREGIVPGGAHVIFLHTGGHPALFR